MKYTFLKQYLFVFLAIMVSIYFSSCKKEKFLTTGGQLSFSTDTLKFDTVFTTVGSVTRSFKVYNNNNKRIKISEIKLEKGSASPYRMNIDGTSTKDITDVEIAPNDSIYVFVALTVDPTLASTPFLVEDKVLFTLNDNTSAVPLESFGQDAHYITDSVLTSQTWTNDKPYVIVHSALVDSANVLTIQKGCRIYMHADSKLYVSGTLFAYGTKTDSVIFQGDRLDRDYFGYKDYPSEWGGIYFTRSSMQSNLNYCIIKNAGNGTGDNAYPAAVFVSPPWVPLGGPIVELNNCTIANSGSYGVLGLNTNIRMNNCLVHSCGLQNIALIEGGEYEFNFCTIANYGGNGLNHAQEPTAAILNYRDIDDVNYVGADLKTTFNNSIIYGSLDDEVFLNKKGTWNYDVMFNNCVLKRTTAFTSGLATFTNVTLNTDPQFTNYGKWDYHPLSTSSLKGAGFFMPNYIFDLDGKNRSTSSPSIGCYEVQ